MTRLEDRLAAADPAADLRPEPAELRDRSAALTAGPPPRHSLAVRLAPALALAGLAVIATVVARGAPRDEREAGAAARPGVVHLRLQVDWPRGAAEEEVWLALDNSSERRLLRLDDGTQRHADLVPVPVPVRRDGLGLRRPESRLLRLLTDVDGNLFRGRLRELRRTTVEGRPVIQVAPRADRGLSAYVDAHFKRPLWLLRGGRLEQVLDWNVLADTPANRGLTEGRTSAG